MTTVKRIVTTAMLAASIASDINNTCNKSRQTQMCNCVPCCAPATARLPCRHVTGQDVCCGRHWNATHSALNSPSGLSCAQVCTDRDAGRPHCCRLAPIRQDALHHLGYVLFSMMQPNFVVCSIVDGHTMRYFG